MAKNLIISIVTGMFTLMIILGVEFFMYKSSLTEDSENLEAYLLQDFPSNDESAASFQPNVYVEFSEVKSPSHPFTLQDSGLVILNTH